MAVFNLEKERKVTYEQWLNTIHHQEENLLEVKNITNREILEMFPEERPTEWWNGFTATQEEIDQRRKESKNSYEWRKDLQKHAPHLDIKAESKLKKQEKAQAEVDSCGHIIKKINKKGIIEKFRKHCNHPDMCPRCRKHAEKQLAEKLHSFDGCRFKEVDKYERAELCKQYGKNNVYFKPIDDTHALAIIDTDDEIGEEFTHNHVKQYATLSPKGSKTSGKLDKKDKPVTTQKKEEKIGEYEQIGIILPVEITEEIEEKIDAEFYKQTKSFKPTNLNDYLRILREMRKIYISIAKVYCDKLHYTVRSIIPIYIEDLDWSDREKYIENFLNKVPITA